MKNHLSIKIVTLLALTVLLNSCGSSNNVVSNKLIQKRKYNKGWHFNSNKNISNSNASKIKVENVEFQKNGEVYTASTPSSKIIKKQVLQNNKIVANLSNADAVKKETPKNEVNFIDNQLFLSKCDRINTNKGFLIEGKVIEIGEKEIKYKKCNDIDGPTFTILKSQVSIINYANGEFDDFREENRAKAEIEQEIEEEIEEEIEDEDHYLHNSENENFSTANQSLETKVEPLGVIAFFLTLASIIAPFLYIAAFFLAIISLIKINKNPKKYRGKVFPSIVIAIALTALLILLIALMIFA